MSLPTSSAIADAIAETLRLDSAAPSPTFNTNSDDEHEHEDPDGSDDQRESDAQSVRVDDDDSDDSGSESDSEIDSDALSVSLGPDTDAESLGSPDDDTGKSVNTNPGVVKVDEHTSKRSDLMTRLASKQSVFFVPNIESEDDTEETTRVPVGLFYISQDHKPQKSRKLFQTAPQQQQLQRFVSIQPSWSSSSKLRKTASLPATRTTSFEHVHHHHIATNTQLPPPPNEDNPRQSLLRTVQLRRTTKRSLGFTITFKDPHPNADDEGGPVQRGAVITAVDPMTLTSDLRVGDVILEVDGVAVPGIAAAQVIIMLDKDNLSLVVRSQPSSVPALRPLHQTILEEGDHDVCEEDELEEVTMTFNRGPKRNPLGFEVSMSHTTNKVHVSRISPGSSQAKTFLVGDQIVTINGIVLSSIPELSMSWVRGLVDRDVVEIKVLRGGANPNACVIS
eukprot:m.134923 g.134923  ORF g.134923 m.134923 type:complete len:449 (+) comp29766_c0_seq1:287-1633(+)